MSRYGVIVGFVLGMGLTAGGCKGESSGGFSPCGGDVTGSWDLVAIDFSSEALENDSFEEPACQDALRDIDLASSTASVTFEQGVATSSGEMELAASYRFDSACIEALTEGLITEASEALCADLGDSMNMGVQEDDSRNSASCSLAGGGCSCEATLFSAFEGTGSYTTSDSTLTIDGESSEYCVRGDRLTVRSGSGEDLAGTVFTFERSG